MSAPGGSGDQVSVTVPRWAVSDWKIASGIALRVLAVFIGIGFLVLLSTVLIFLIRFGTSGMDLEGLLATAFSLPLLYLGGFQNSPILLTGIAVLMFAFRRSSSSLRLVGWQNERVRLIALAAKVGLVAVGMMIVLAVIMDALDLLPATSLGSGLGLIQSTNIDYVRLVFLTAPVIAVVAALEIARSSDVSLIGQSIQIPGLVRSSWFGLKQTIRIALPGLLVLFALGSVLELLSADFGDFGLLMSSLLSILLLVVVFVAVDAAVLFLVGAMSFLQFQGLGGVEAWAWAGVALVAVAFFIGGRHAAQTASPSTVAESVTAASLIGVLLSGLGILVAINYQGLANLNDFAAPAILLPLVWTIPALLGAWWHASQVGLPSGVALSVSDADGGQNTLLPTEQIATPPQKATPEDLDTSNQPSSRRASEPAEARSLGWACGNCGASNPSSHRFCSSCGTPKEGN